MEEEDQFYQDEYNYNNDIYERNERSNKNNEDEDDKMMNIAIELMISYQDYFTDEAIPIGESLKSIDLFEFIKYGY